VPTLFGIEVLDSATGQQAAPTISIGGLPTWIITSPDGTRLYTANTAGGSLSVIDAATGHLTATTSLPSGAAPLIVAARPGDGSQVWMANSDESAGVTVFSADGALLKTIPTVGGSIGVNLSPDGRYAYVLDSGAGCNIADNGVLTLILAFLGGCPGPGDIRVLRTSDFTQAGPPIPAGSLPAGLYTLEPGTEVN
jgi:YVTN family beta-propeller protein